MPEREKTVAVLGLLTGAFVWGLIWYPYRVLAAAGFSGLMATPLSYGVALLLGLVAWRRALRACRPSWLLVAIALSAGGCNFGYVLATLHGNVMRVLLLFYLSPLWTVLLSRLILGERLGRAGAVVIALSLAGAATMLWDPRSAVPLSWAAAEWIGMAAGLLFALSNVLVRKADGYPIEVKSVAVFAGVVALGIAALPFHGAAAPPPLAAGEWLLVLLLGVVLLLVNMVVQHGLMRIPANRAIVIMLAELVVAALSSWLLSGETMATREWLGAVLIVAASLLSGRLEEPRPEPAGQAQAG